jgi:DNA-binding NarL/FixJ family response regulator
MTAISPRPLTDAERARIRSKHDRIRGTEQRAREMIRDAVADRDAEIADAVRAGASQTDIATELDMSRQGISDAVKRGRQRLDG